MATPFSAADFLLRRLGDCKPAVRKAAAQRLVQIPNRNALPALQEALESEQDPNVLKWIALALSRQQDVSTLKLLDRRLSDVEDLDAQDWLAVSRFALDQSINGDSGEDVVVQRLESNDPNDKRVGASHSWAVRNLSDKATRLLLEAIEHQDPEVRRWAVLSLSNKSQRPSLHSLLPGLSDPDYLVREWTECGLASIGDRRAESFLLAGLDDTHPRVREWAVKAIASFQSDGTPRLLLNQFKFEQDELCREGIITALMPWARRPDIRKFVIGQLKVEESAIVLSSLIDLVTATSNLLMDPEVQDILISHNARLIGLGLTVQMTEALLQGAASSEVDQIRRILGSRRLSTIYELISASKVGYNSTEENYDLGAKPGKSEQLILSHMDRDMTGNTIEQQSFDVAILVPLREEFETLWTILGKPIKTHLIDETGEHYYEYRYGNGPDGRVFRLITTFVGRMGPADMGIMAERLLSRFQPQLVAVLGIAGGIDEDLRLGDVIVPSLIEAFLSGAKAVPNQTDKASFELKFSGDPRRTSADLVRRIEHLQFAHLDLYARWRNGAEAFLRKEVVPELLQKLDEKGFTSNMPELVTGHIACGDVVGGAKAFSDLLLTIDRTYKALEMESSGLLIAAEFYKRTDTIVVRGISDFADKRKKTLDNIGKGAFRRVAMHNAITAFLLLLDTLPQQQDKVIK